MRLKITLLSLTFLFSFNLLIAQEEQVSQEEMMKIWTEYMTPSDVHKKFKS